MSLCERNKGKNKIKMFDIFFARINVEITVEYCVLGRKIRASV